MGGNTINVYAYTRLPNTDPTPRCELDALASQQVTLRILNKDSHAVRTLRHKVSHRFDRSYGVKGGREKMTS